jgi:hypothetical protein
VPKFVATVNLSLEAESESDFSTKLGAALTAFDYEVEEGPEEILPEDEEDEEPSEPTTEEEE